MEEEEYKEDGRFDSLDNEKENKKEKRDSFMIQNIPVNLTSIASGMSGDERLSHIGFNSFANLVFTPNQTQGWDTKDLSPDVEPEDLASDYDDFEFVIMFRESQKDADQWKFLWNSLDSPDADAIKTMLLSDDMKKRRIRNNIIKCLSDAGLIWRLTRSRVDPEIIFLLVGATDERVAEKAEHMGVELPLKREFGGGFVPFDRTQKQNYQPCQEARDDDLRTELDPSIHQLEPHPGEDLLTRSLFGSSVRQDIIYHIIVDEKYSDNSADVDLGTLLEEGLITKYFPVHTQVTRRLLMRTWGKGFLKKQPLSLIKNYFGESMGLFFGFLGFASKYYLIASIVGIPIFGLWYKFGSGWYVSVYSLFLALWATVFLNFWKRKQANWNFLWNMTEWDFMEPTRPAFVGEDRKGFEQDGIWVAFDGKGKSSIEAKTNKYFPIGVRYFRMVMSMIPMTIMGLFVIVVTVGILSFRLWLQRQSIGNFGTYIGAAVNSITIIILNVIYDKIATILTNWENHRTQSHYDNWLIIKLFLFQFVNSYTSLFYIAFYKNGTKLWGSDRLEDRCQDYDLTNRNPLGGGCINELQIQVGTFLVISTLANQVSITILPWILNNWKRILCFACKRGNKRKLPRWEKEAILVPDEGDIHKYNQLIIQYGYVVLFGAAFPLAPVIALFNNLLNIRVYSFQMLSLNNRPIRRGANSIGVWYWILEFLGFMAVMTNCALIGFTHPIIYNYLTDPFKVLIVIVILEHIIVFIKLLMEVLIPDAPYEVRKAKIKQDWIERGVFDRMDSEARKKSSTTDEALEMRKMMTKQANKKMTFDQDSSSILPIPIPNLTTATNSHGESELTEVIDTPPPSENQV